MNSKWHVKKEKNIPDTFLSAVYDELVEGVVQFVLKFKRWPASDGDLDVSVILLAS